MDSAISGVQKYIEEKIIPAAEKAWEMSRASETQKYAQFGLILSGLCEDADQKNMQNYCLGIIERISSDILKSIRAVQGTLLLANELRQAWDAVPTWDEFAAYLREELEEKMVRAALGTVIGLLKAAACGTRYQKMFLVSCKGIVSAAMIKTAVMTSLKTLWDLHSATGGKD